MASSFFIMENKKHLYWYIGPVYLFGQIIEPNWKASTYAVSKGKAKTNLIFQYKNKTNRTQNSKIDLEEDKIILSR